MRLQNLHTAYFYARMAYEDLLTAYQLQARDQFSNHHRESGIDSLKRAADAIGFDLVERAPLTVMSKDTFMDKINAATKTIPVSELMHGTSNANDLMSDALGNVVGPR